MHVTVISNQPVKIKLFHDFQVFLKLLRGPVGASGVAQGHRVVRGGGQKPWCWWCLPVDIPQVTVEPTSHTVGSAVTLVWLRLGGPHV